MFENLEVFKMAHAMATHAGQKQAMAAQNVANADTPEYKAQAVMPFADMYESKGDLGSWLSQKATRTSHLNGIAASQLAPTFEDPDGVENPNGNSVSLESEMLKSLDAKRQHDRALAIYKSALGMLRITLSPS